MSVFVLFSAVLPKVRLLLGLAWCCVVCFVGGRGEPLSRSVQIINLCTLIVTVFAKKNFIVFAKTLTPNVQG